MTYTDYAQKEWLGRGINPKRGHKRHPDSNGFLSYVSNYKRPAALAILGVMAAAGLACSVLRYVSKERPADDAPGYSRSVPRNFKTPESRLEEIAKKTEEAGAHGIRLEANITADPETKPGAGGKRAEPKDIKDPAASVDALAGYIMQTYKGWTRRDMPENTAHDYSGWIVKYAGQYNINPLLLAALISHESRFTNVNGDLVVNGRRTANNSEGVSQIRKETQKEIRRLMIKKGEKIRPNYENLNSNPELAIRMTAFYLNYLMERKGITLWRAFGHYNGGSFMNAAYANKVMGEHSRILKYFSTHQDDAGNEMTGAR